MEPIDVILIDDSVFDLFIYEKLLEKSKLTRSIQTFSSARIALKFLQDQQNTLPETIILLDLQMPDMNGFEFIEHFALESDGLKAKVKILMLSSTIDSRDIERAIANPYILEILGKPLDIEVLKKKLNHMQNQWK